jgi:hypothetical protein
MFSLARKNGGFPISTALSHEEIVRLQAEPEWRNRWTETWVSLEPLLKEIEDIIWTKAHLAEPVKLNSVTATFTFRALGCSWEEAFVSPGLLYQTVAVWTRQWCAPFQFPLPDARLCHAPCAGKSPRGRTVAGSLCADDGLEESTTSCSPRRPVWYCQSWAWPWPRRRAAACARRSCRSATD